MILQALKIQATIVCNLIFEIKYRSYFTLETTKILNLFIGLRVCVFTY